MSNKTSNRLSFTLPILILLATALVAAIMPHPALVAPVIILGAILFIWSLNHCCHVWMAIMLHDKRQGIQTGHSLGPRGRVGKPH